ncbi:MAG: tetratricopeptide repeat protein, partial [Cyanobacteria bacterium J083]
MADVANRIRQYRKIAQHNPESAQIKANLGNLYALQQDWQKAITAYRQALAIDPELVGIYRNLAQIYQKIGKINQAIQVRLQALKLEENEASALEYYQIGRYLKNKNKLGRAIFCLRQAIKLDPDFLSAHYILAAAFKQQGKKQAAIQVCRRALKQKPGVAYSHYHLALALVNIKAWRRAIEHLQKAITLNNNIWQFEAELGNCFWQQGLWQAAEISYQKTLRLNPAQIDSRFNLALSLIKQNKINKGINQLYQVIKQSHHTRNKQSLAINLCYQTIKTKSPQSAQDYYQLGLLLRQIGRFPLAVELFGQAIALEPSFWAAYTTLQYTQIKPNQLPRLINYYQIALDSAPDYPLLWGNLGDALSEQGKLNQAIECYQNSVYYQAIRNKPNLTRENWQINTSQAPDFLIIGAAKCGTTSLYQYLGFHPQILLPHKKELNFFNRYFTRGMPWYLAHFPASTEQIKWFTGEATPQYFNNPIVAKKIAKYSPQTKLILLLRNPIEQTISWYFHLKNSGLVQHDLGTNLK